MRVHLLAIPACQTTRAYNLDGFNMMTIRFAEVLKRLGVYTILYGSEETEAPCVDFVTCITKKEIADMLGAGPYQRLNYDGANPIFTTFNARVGTHLRGIKEPGDIIATICGTANHHVSQMHPELPCVEYSIGYRGVFAPFRVYQSQAWRHVVLGFTGSDGGREFDGVIPPCFEVEQFPFEATPSDYLLYCGRLDVGKGIRTAEKAAKAAGAKLLIVGHGGDEKAITYGDYMGTVSNEERNRLLAGARAVLMPTQYVEPFGNVCAEAQLCGTPVISTDYGAFIETVEHGRTGFRCNYLGGFVEAIERVGDLDRAYIRQRAESLWSLEAAVVSYRAYFRRLALVNGEGWNSLQPTVAPDVVAV
jgi:glycosyltransferase involved in cell wall biosynthesis